MPKLRLAASVSAMEAQLSSIHANFVAELHRNRVLALAQENSMMLRVERKLILLMAHIQQGRYESDEIAALVPRGDRNIFQRRVANALVSKSPLYRRRALIITFHMLGISPALISEFLVFSQNAIRKLVREFRKDGAREILYRPSNRIKKAERQDLRDRLFAIMHTPPIEYDINRTTWTIKLLQRALANEGVRIGHNTIGAMIRNEGYNFRKTRQVLTSNDPDYRCKLKKITNILRRLGHADRFFSVDEYGPFSVKQHGGRRRVRKGEYPTVPQYQISKGSLILTAALELSTNQVTHFYSNKKDSGEMIELLRVLLRQYSGCRRIYFSWDGASWHSSKRFLAEVRRRKSNNTPIIKLAPLPAKAQFLNVIESVFSGMSRSIIQNSDYESISSARAAIDRYFEERNEYFLKNPKRAGKKIWGKEMVPSRFNESHNCKDPRRMRLAALRR
jgi:transposase